MQSALEAVKGVKEAQVSLENHEAVVKYDSDVVTVEDLIKVRAFGALLESVQRLGGCAASKIPTASPNIRTKISVSVHSDSAIYTQPR